MELWNEICFLVNQYRKSNAAERDFQIEAENIFEKLGWSRYRGEIVRQETILVGSAQFVKPDIIIKNGGSRAFVVELKKPNAELIARNAEQLISYMRLLKLDFGLLLGDVLQVYYEAPGDGKAPIKIIEIPFVPDDSDGAELIDLISKINYDRTKFAAYCSERLQRERQSGLISMLCSETGKQFVKDTLRSRLTEKEPADIIDAALAEVTISIQRKTNNTTRPVQVQHTVSAPNSSSKQDRAPIVHNDIFRGLKVGQIANTILRGALERGIVSDEELALMQTKEYSKKTFGIDWPLLVVSNQDYDPVRYYKEPLWIKSKQYYLSSQWFEVPANNDRVFLAAWLQAHGIEPR